ncbi:MAG: DEAD/DEAH box helicase [Oligoflexales bacterium]
MDELLAIVREEASREAWSAGVRMSRSGVSGQKHDLEESVLTVSDPVRKQASVVTLWPEDSDWKCSCGGTQDPCSHVVAAVIVAKQSQKTGTALPVQTRAGTVRYDFNSQSGRLAFVRGLEHAGKIRPLLGRLTSLVSDGRLAATGQDLAIDRLLQPHTDGIFTAAKMEKLLALLAKMDTVYLNGAKVSVSAEARGVQLLVSKSSEGWKVRKIDDPMIELSFENGAAVCQQTLHPLNAQNLTRDQYEWLQKGALYQSEQIADLFSVVLPEWQRLGVQHLVQGGKQPELVAVDPYMSLETQEQQGVLHVVPVIEYGDPVVAQVRRGRLVTFGSDVIPIRDLKQETNLLGQVSRMTGVAGSGSAFEGAHGVRFLEKSCDYPVKGTGQELFQRHGEIKPDPSWDQGVFQISFQGDQQTFSLHHIRQVWQERESLIQLHDGRWMEIPVEWLSKYADRVEALLEATQLNGTTPACLKIEVMEIFEGSGETLPEDFENLQNQPTEIALPDDFQGDLREYQKESHRWMSWLEQGGMGAILADDMGLGKTVQAITILKGRALVIAPYSVLQNWMREVERFRPGLPVAVYHGPGRQLPEGDGITLTTWGLLRSDIEILSHIRWDVVVLDEAHQMKNPSSQNAKSAMKLQSRFRLALTGTPIENKLSDLWSQMQFANPYLLGRWKDFQVKFANPIQAGDQRALGILKARIQPFLMRRTKSLVASELPPRTETILYCELDEQEQEVYQSVATSTRNDILKEVESGRMMLALEMLLRMRQAACHVALVPGQNYHRSSKLAVLIERLKETLDCGHKSLVFSQWTKFLDLVQRELQGHGVDTLRIDGTTKNRQDIVDKFQSGEDSPSVMLLSLKAAGVGLNLTAADHVYILDPWWNPAAEDQAADRAHRIGQQKPVLVHKVVAKGTVEERILMLQDAKRQMGRSIMEEGTGALQLTKDDLLELLSDAL